VSTASLKWVERLGAAEPCHVATMEGGRPRACPRASIAYCVVCHKPTCLVHAFVDGSGEAVCFACVQETIAERPAAPKPNGKTNGAGQAPPYVPPDWDKQVSWARKQLKVKMSASWDDIRTAHRKLSAKWHPDKVQGADAKAKAEAKFKELGRALEILKKEYAQ
jgi:hypothetical protein